MVRQEPDRPSGSVCRVHGERGEQQNMQRLLLGVRVRDSIHFASVIWCFFCSLPTADCSPPRRTKNSTFAIKKACLKTCSIWPSIWHWAPSFDLPTQQFVSSSAIDHCVPIAIRRQSPIPSTAISARYFSLFSSQIQYTRQRFACKIALMFRLQHVVIPPTIRWR